MGPSPNNCLKPGDNGDRGKVLEISVASDPAASRGAIRLGFLTEFAGGLVHETKAPLVSSEMITAIATCVVAVVTGAGVVIAARGLRSWREQLEGSAHFDLARRLLLQVYRLRDAIEGVRRPWMDISEAGDTHRDLPWEVSAYEERWKLVVDARAPLEVCVYEAQILWDDEARELWRLLMGQTQRLYVTLGTFARYLQEAKDNQLTQEERDVLYGSDDDAFSVELTGIVDKFEAYVRPHLPRKRARA